MRETAGKVGSQYVVPGKNDGSEHGGEIYGAVVTSADNMAGRALDARLAKQQLERDSDKGYREIAKQVVGIADTYLTKQIDKKSNLREGFASFFKWLLGGQLVALVLMIALSAIEPLAFSVSENILTAYIVSVFVETLGAIGVMLAFAFASKEETEIVKVLTMVIQNYQKYREHDNKKGE